VSYVELARRFLAARRCQTVNSNVDDLREWFEERAAIIEYDGKTPRYAAEQEALGYAPIRIEWPPLPARNLEGEALDAAWSDFWSQVESQLHA
jgi:hypothetical protein